jgi:DtxR family Mn-dependent transcriptional regulator
MARAKANIKSKSDNLPPSRQRLSMTAENYLLSIYRLNEEDALVTLTQLAEHLKVLPEGEGLGTSLPTVGGMIRRLEREGLIAVDSKRQLSLTRKGTRHAESIVRRHRLAERMVVDMLDVELHRAHVEAHLLEHAISPYLEERIMKKLGMPTTSPFGYPIPGTDYVQKGESFRLNEAEAGRELVIDKIPVDDEVLLEHLVQNQVIPGNAIEVNEINTSTGIISFKCMDKVVVVGYQVGQFIWLCTPGE